MILYRKHLLIAYLIAVFVLETQTIRISDFRFNLIFYFAVSALCFFGLVKRINYKLLYKDFALLFFFLYMLFCSLSFYWSFIGFESLLHTLPIWLSLVIPLCFYKFDFEVFNRYVITITLIYLCLGWILLVVFPSAAVLPDIVWRFTGLMTHPQRLSLVCGFLGIILVCNFFNKSHNSQSLILYSIVFLFVFATLILTKARAFTVFFMITIFVITFLRTSGLFRFIYGVACSLAAFVLYHLSDYIENILFRDDIGDASLTGRIPTWLNALELIYDNPLIGYGFGSFFSDLTEEQGRTYVSPHAHNTWINTLLENGIIGTVLITSFMILILIKSMSYQIKAKKISITFHLVLFSIFCGSMGIVYGGKITFLLCMVFLFYIIEVKRFENKL